MQPSQYDTVPIQLTLLCSKMDSVGIKARHTLVELKEMQDLTHVKTIPRCQSRG